MDNNTKNNPKETHQELNLKDLNPNPYQNRINFDPQKLQELAQDIKTSGLRQPIDVIIEPLSNKYYIVAGERRYKAHLLNQAQTIKAIVRQPATQDEAIQTLIKDMANENHLSVSPDSIEVAIFYRKNLRHLKNQPNSLTSKRFATQEELATSLLGILDKNSLDAIEERIFNNKKKHISKAIKNFAYSTNHIEDIIENKKGTEYNYLMYKIAELGKLLNIENVTWGAKRHKEKSANEKKYPLSSIKQVSNKFQELKRKNPNSSESEILENFTNEEKTLYKKSINQKREKIINDFYDHFNAKFKKGIPNLENLNNELDQKYKKIYFGFETNKKLKAQSLVTSYKEINSSIKKDGKKTQISIDTSKIPEELKANLNETLKALENQLNQIKTQIENN